MMFIILCGNSFEKPDQTVTSYMSRQFRTWLDENPTLTGDLDQVVAEDQLVNYENGDPMFAQVEEATNNYP